MKKPHAAEPCKVEKASPIPENVIGKWGQVFNCERVDEEVGRLQGHAKVIK